jgi:hypothetical protein
MTFHARLLPPGSVAPESHIMRGRPRQLKPTIFMLGFAHLTKRKVHKNRSFGKPVSDLGTTVKITIL